MGGQACIFYGAAEFSRDTDFVVLLDPENMSRLREALDELQAVCVAVPPFHEDYLRRGHAVHFRAQHPEAAGIRIDMMARMRNVAPFDELWLRRTSLTLSDGSIVDLLSLTDLVQAKKTQRDKDWPMIRRLVEADFFRFSSHATDKQVDFWLRELRTPELLIELAKRVPSDADQLSPVRPLLRCAITGDVTALTEQLALEEQRERAMDRAYWQPLKAELEALRAERRTS